MSDQPDNNKSGLPLIVTPETGKPKSPIILPSAATAEVMPGTVLETKLRLDDKTLQQLGVKSEADLGDDIELERSPHDKACVISAKKDGMPVCWYCFLPFVNGLAEYEPVEIQIGKPDGAEQGLRAKVHGSCQLKKMKEMAAKGSGPQ
jgi:hypothetical protein